MLCIGSRRSELCKDHGDFDEGQNVIDRRLGQGISKTTGLVEFSRCAVFSN